jgi:hypothetical protein
MYINWGTLSFVQGACEEYKYLPKYLRVSFNYQVIIYGLYTLRDRDSLCLTSFASYTNKCWNFRVSVRRRFRCTTKFTSVTTCSREVATQYDRHSVRIWSKFYIYIIRTLAYVLLKFQRKLLRAYFVKKFIAAVT